MRSAAASIDKLKRGFFDRKAVAEEVGKGAAQALARAGAFVRTKGRSLLRRRKGPSAPGSPPSVHSSDRFATLKNILFAWDSRTKSVVVGPVRLNLVNRIKLATGGSTGQGGRATVPELHEHGGTNAIVEWLRPQADIPIRRLPNGIVIYKHYASRWERADLRHRISSKASWRKRIRTAKYPARPTMQPAMEQGIAELLRKFKNCIVTGRAA